MEGELQAVGELRRLFLSETKVHGNLSALRATRGPWDPFVWLAKRQWPSASLKSRARRGRMVMGNAKRVDEQP